MDVWKKVSTAEELTAALAAGAKAIEVQGEIRGMPMITLDPGVRLRGGALVFGAKGVCLTSDNVLESIAIRCPDHEVAILNDTQRAGLGTLRLEDVRTSGQVLLLACDAVRAGHVQVRGLTVESADLRGRVDRPHGFGVDAMQGAFTLWNQQADPEVVLTAELIDIAAGKPGAPVRGSGVFVGGHGTTGGGVIRVTTLQTGEVHTDGGIAPGTPDLISGGVFVIYGASVERVVNAGSVTTHGQNDMVLDNWGDVMSWTAKGRVTSHGPSGIGFVNFGAIDRLDVEAPIETTGTGARGFNLLDGSLRHASFDSITTNGDGACGVQITQPLPRLEIRGDLRTSGGLGLSLSKGVQTLLKAFALDIPKGGVIGAIHVGGRIQTRGANVVTVVIEGQVGELQVKGGIKAKGVRSNAVHVVGSVPGLDAIEITAVHGRRIVHEPAAGGST